MIFTGDELGARLSWYRESVVPSTERKANDFPSGDTTREPFVRSVCGRRLAWKVATAFPPGAKVTRPMFVPPVSSS